MSYALATPEQSAQSHRPLSNRKAIAAERALAARSTLGCCRLCAHECQVNRLHGPNGICHAGPSGRIFSAQVEVSDELDLIPTFAIALSGCDLRCAFCITGRESWNPMAGEVLHPGDVAAKARRALANGARTVMILGGEPTIHLPSALEIVAHLPNEARLVWKTNAHGSAQSRELLAGIFDIWLADYKFGNDGCAQRLARAPDYTSVIRENLRWAACNSEVIIRHLVMPGHVDCCWRAVADWIASELPEVKVNLRAGFWPGWQASRHGELRRTVSNTEADEAWGIAREFALNLIE